MPYSVLPRPHRQACLARQQGIALLTILLMVAIASILTMGILNQQQRMSRESSVTLRQDQSWVYAKSGEYFLSELLVDDAKNSNKSDNLAEKWAKPMPVFPIPDGSITGRITDESGKFNLNNLFLQDTKKPNPEAMKYFGNLLKRVGLSADLVNSVVDWEDPDDQLSGSFGAEDSFYLGHSPGYLAANCPFSEIAELKKVRGFDGANYDRIAPYITALPYPTKINVNTASPMVLSALDDSLNDTLVKQWVEQRDKSMQYLEDVGKLWEQPGFQQVQSEKRGVVAPLLAVRSDFFKAEVIVTLSGRKRFLNSRLYRNGQTVMAYQRSITPVSISQFASGDTTKLLQQLLNPPQS